MRTGGFIPKGIEVNEYSADREKAYRDVVESFEGVVERLEEGEQLTATITHHSNEDGIWYETRYTISSNDTRGTEWSRPVSNSVEG